ncbi:MAG: pilus assembly protein [Sporomusaceae bacterium]|nr:pilus assembly protein [Sporomusaceae bacterium]
MRTIYRYVRNRRGQAIVEFALVLPVFLLLLVGMMEFGLVLHDYVTVAEAARVGARAASVHKDNATITAATKNAAPGLSADQLTVTITPDVLTARTTDTAVTVTVVYPVPTYVPSITNPWSGEEYAILPATVNVTGRAVMRME